jgi:hypothetical protein
MGGGPRMSRAREDLGVEGHERQRLSLGNPVVRTWSGQESAHGRRWERGQPGLLDGLERGTTSACDGHPQKGRRDRGLVLASGAVLPREELVSLATLMGPPLARVMGPGGSMSNRSS